MMDTSTKLYQHKMKFKLQEEYENPNEAARYKGFFAYEAMKEKFTKFNTFQRENAFQDYKISLAKQDFSLLLDDLNNFIEWHKVMFSLDVHFVYIFFKELNEQFIPLYVGKTKNLKARLSNHAEKQWFQHASNLAIEPYYFDGDATVREHKLIRELVPLFNKVIDGFSMFFPKDEIEITVPKQNNVSTYNIAPANVGVEHFEKLGAVTKHKFHNSLIKKSKKQTEN